MTDSNKHLNLFYTYNTHHLEDNVTRALAITLKNLSPVHLRLLLSDLILPKIADRRPDLANKIRLLQKPSFSFDLQISPPLEEDKLDESTGLIIGINYSGRQHIPFDPAYIASGGARPDMLLSDEENEMTFISEAKLYDALYQEQIHRHFNQFFNTATADLNRVFCEISWTDIAGFLSRLEQQSRSSLESFLVREFNEYLDRLSLTEFLAFREDDFRKPDVAKLHNFLMFITSELGQESNLNEYKFNQMIFFNDIQPDNVWMDIEEESLIVGIVIGSGKIWRARQMKDFLQRDNETFKTLLDSLRRQIPNPVNVRLRVLSTFRLSRFRTVLLDSIGGYMSFPENYDSFSSVFLDPRKNSHGRLTKNEIMDAFRPEIDAQIDETRRDSNGFFPPWKDANDFLQYLYFHVDLKIPKDQIVGKGRADLEDLFRPLLGAIRTFFVDLNNAILVRR